MMSDTKELPARPLTIRPDPRLVKILPKATPSPIGSTKRDHNPRSNTLGQYRALLMTVQADRAAVAAAQAAAELAKVWLAREIAVEAATAPEEAAIGPFGWAAIGFGGAVIGGTAGLLAYRLHQSANAKKKLAADKKRLRSLEKSIADAKPRKDNVKVPGDEPKECIVGPYKDVEPKCPGEAHHIIPDRVYRLGDRPKVTEYDSPNGRVPGTPTFNQGQTVCLSPAEHRTGQDAVHKNLDSPLSDYGKTQTPPGTAKLSDILQKVNNAIDQIPTLSQECKNKAKDAATNQVRPIRNKPGRTGMRAPTDSKAIEVLKQGYF